MDPAGWPRFQEFLVVGTVLAEVHPEVEEHPPALVFNKYLVATDSIRAVIHRE